MSNSSADAFIVLDGTSTLETLKATASKVGKPEGQGDWLNFLDKKPDILATSDKAVIFNNVNALLRFNFTVVGGSYNITIRCICPNGNSDSGYYSLNGDVFPQDNMKWSMDFGPKKNVKYIEKQYMYKLFTNLSLNSGSHYLNFLYREPLAIIDVTVKNASTSEQIVMKAIDILNEKLKTTTATSSFVEMATVNADPVVISMYTPTSAPVANVPQAEVPTQFSTNVPSTSGTTVVSEKTASGDVVPVVTGLAPVPVVVVEPVVQPVPPPPIVLPVMQPMVTPPPYVVTPSPRPGVVAVAPAPVPLFESTGNFINAETNNYYMVVFTGNGTIKFNRSMQVNVLAVGGGGGGAGGAFEITNKFYSYGKYTGGNGGDGGANILGVLSADITKRLNVVIGQGGASGNAGQSGSNGGDTVLNDGTTTYITCKGGNGGRFNKIDTSEYTASDNEFALGADYYKEQRMNPMSSSFYTINSAVISSVQAGGAVQNKALQGGLGGLGGYLIEESGKKDVGTNGDNSLTYNIPFKNIPSELTLIRTNYGGAGGGGDYRGGGKNGQGKGGVAGYNNNNIGASGSFPGTGGGGGFGNNPGGTGYAGILIFFFPKTSATATTTNLSSTLTVTANNTVVSPIYMTTTMSPVPLLNLRVWLDASKTSSWTSTVWKNSAPSSTINAVIYTGMFPNTSFVSSAVSGLPGVYFDGKSSYSLAEPVGTYSGGATLFVVFQPTASNTYKTLLSRTLANAYPAPFDMYNERRFVGSSAKANLINSPVNINTLPINKPYIFAFRMNYTATNATTYVSEWLNGVLKYENTAVSNYKDEVGSLYIGTRQSKDTQFTGYMSEILVYNKVMTNAEVQNMNLYLATKWKVV